MGRSRAERRVSPAVHLSDEPQYDGWITIPAGRLVVASVSEAIHGVLTRLRIASPALAMTGGGPGSVVGGPHGAR